MMHIYESRLRLTHVPSGRVITASGEWRESLQRMRQTAIQLLAAQLWRDANEPADVEREVAAYVLPDDVEAPHDLAPYRIGPAIGAAQRGEGVADV